MIRLENLKTTTMTLEMIYTYSTYNKESIMAKTMDNVVTMSNILCYGNDSDLYWFGVNERSILLV